MNITVLITMMHPDGRKEVYDGVVREPVEGQKPWEQRYDLVLVSILYPTQSGGW